MKAEIICVGTELLLGDILNTNARFLARQLAAMGFTVQLQTVVGDNAGRLEAAVEQAKERCDLILFSGGLGPTDDDLTKQTVARAFGDTLVSEPSLEMELEDFFAKRGVVMTENNKKQALVPAHGKWLKNENGTAPGIVFYQGGKTAVLLPGPPKELEPMFSKEVVPLLKTYQDGVIKSLVLCTFGIGESSLEELVKPLLEGENPTAALYAKEGEVHIRITARAENEREAYTLCRQLAVRFYEKLGEFVYGEDSPGLEYEVVRLLSSRFEQVATAESCTGGLLSQRLTAVSGASTVFQCGVCSYSNQVKTKLLSVEEELLQKYGAVSSPVAAAMAAGVRSLASATYGVGITGIAGPGGGTAEKPVGLVYVAVNCRKGTYIKKLVITGASRERVRRISTQQALDMLRRLCTGKPLRCAKFFESGEMQAF